MIEDAAFTSDEAISSGTWELEIVGRRYPATVSLQAMYDPKRERIKA
jgi:glycine cleavage system aminomethyltransferase T